MILHIDMDAFYASIEERDRPGLRGKPMVVGGNPGKRGVVAAANYTARRYGIHSAMPTAQAKHLCPNLIVLPPRHGYYAQVSQQIRDIFHRYTPLVEPLSLDEAFLDVKHSHLLFGEPADIGWRIKREIREELKLTASVGVAHNKFLAKVASDVGKPDGFLVINPASSQSFLDPLPVSKLWGVGRVGNRRLQNLGIHTIGDLRARTPALLDDLFGSWGGTLWELAHGIDERPVVPDHKAKSLSHETTFAEDITDVEALRGWLLDLTRQVAMRLRRNRLHGRTVHLKIRFSNFRTITRSRTLPQSTDVTQELWDTGLALLRQNLPLRHRGVRLLGFSVSGFDPTGPCQTDLFDESVRSRQVRLDTVSDWIQARFGSAALTRATELVHATD
ncbi:MAG: DNA polymerase IV [Gammaproteobacteria bacterium]|nr:DNA polymerase IV [Gammaproteobacteria bacterium]